MKNNLGFTILELLTTLGVVALLSAIAFPSYQNYIVNAETVDSLETVVVLEEQLNILAETQTGQKHTCDDRLAHDGLDNQYLEQSIFPMPTGEAALGIVANYDKHGATGIAVAKKLHEELTGLGKHTEVDVIGDALVVYRTMLTPQGRVFCDLSKTAASPLKVASSTSATTQPAKAQPSTQNDPKPPAKRPQPDPIAQYVPGTVTEPTPSNPSTESLSAPVDQIESCPKGHSAVGADSKTVGYSLHVERKDGSIRANLSSAEPIQCHLCRGPKFICERSHRPQACTNGTVTNPVVGCINDIENLSDGSRYIDRRCATLSDIQKDDLQDSRGRPECDTYDTGRLVDRHFSCSFACTGNNCNMYTVPQKISTEQVEDISKAQPLRLSTGEFCVET